MMEVSSSVNKQEEDENELSLELSIGRKCYKKTTPSLPVHFTEQISTNNSSIVSPRSQPLIKRAVQALRRQEARKKREEKMTMMRFKSSPSSCILLGGDNENVCCVINREDHAVDMMPPPRKKEKCQTSCHDDNNVVSNVVRDFKLNINDDHASSLMLNQYVPFTNGFVYHPPLGSVVACTNRPLMDKDKRRVSFDTEACRSFRPYSRRRNIDIINGNAKSDASSGATSSAVSDHHKSSLQGCSSSINVQLKCWDSTGMGSNEVKVKTKANHTVNMASSTDIQARESMCSEEPKPAAPLTELILSTKNPIHPALSKKETSNGAITNPQKSQPECNVTLPLTQMPCVSTTGNGPNGKTVTGFLYRYTKTEVCIVCVCHGTSFSPAEFVKHAGGVDVEHPLRHITIVPSDLA